MGERSELGVKTVGGQNLSERSELESKLQVGGQNLVERSEQFQVFHSHSLKNKGTLHRYTVTTGDWFSRYTH